MNEKDSKALYRKWRPRTWDEVKYQDHVVRTLRNAIAKDKVGHAYIFSGPRGTGKTTAARLLAKAVNCTAQNLSDRPCNNCPNCNAFNRGEYLDLIEIDAASHTGVDDARELIENVRYSPSMGTYKVYIIDEVHMLSKQAFNALLKTIEEPPKHVIFILATTELDKVMPTILSRCQRFEFRRFELSGLIAHLAEICAKEGIDAEDDALMEIAKFSNGGMRDAISLLDQLSNVDGKLTLSVVQSILGTATEKSVFELIVALADDNAAEAIELTHATLDKGANPLSYTRQIVETLRQILLYQIDPARFSENTHDVEDSISKSAAQISQPDLIELIRIFNEILQNSRIGWSPLLSLEVAIARGTALLNQKLEVSPSRAKPGKALQNQEEKTERSTYPKAVEKAASSKQVAAEDVKASSEEKKPIEKIESKTEEKESNPSAESKKMISNAAERLNRTEFTRLWEQLIQSLNQHDRSYAALLRSAKIMEIKKDEVIIGFSQILKDKFDKNPLNSELQSTFKNLSQTNMLIRAVALKDNGNLPDDMDQNGMVALAKDLGGKLVK